MSPQNHPTRQAIYAKLQAQNQPEALPEHTLYPRYMYNTAVRNAKPKIVYDEQQEAALGPEWGYLPYQDEIVPDVDSEPLLQPLAKPGRVDPAATAGVGQVLPPPPGAKQNSTLETGSLTMGAAPAQTPSPTKRKG